jgi:hypothetical protein
MANQISPRMLRLFRTRFIDDYCTSESLGQVCALDDRILERVANVGEGILLERHNTNKQVIKLIKDRSERSDRLEGFYILYPINSECEKLIEDGSILTSRQITTDHICEESGQASSLYLSMCMGEQGARKLISFIFCIEI